MIRSRARARLRRGPAAAASAVVVAVARRTLVIMFGGLLAVTAAPITTASAAACTIEGGPGADRLVGTAGDDVICGNGGADVLVGKGDNDRLLGGVGAHRLLGGAGADVLKAGRGNDFLDGGRRADSFKGGAGFDTLSYEGRKVGVIADPFGRRDDGVPGEGDHTWRARIDKIVGGAGSDRLHLPAVGGVVVGGPGDDSLHSRQGGGTLLGGAGADRLFGSREQDTMRGGAGPDVLIGHSGRDRIDGGRGQDWCDLDPEDRATRCSTDVPAPWVRSLSVDRVDAEPGDTVTVTVEVGAATGVADARVNWRSGKPSAPLICQAPARLTSGNLRSGTWTQTCTIPDEAENGEYLLVASIQDYMGTWNDTEAAPTPTAAIEISGSFYDRIGPSVDTVTVDPTTVSPGETVSVTGHLSDRDGVKTAWVQIHLVDDRFAGHNIEEMELVSGPNHDGTWTQSLEVPLDAPEGSYLVHVSGMDMLGYSTVPDAPGNYSNPGLTVGR